MVTRSANNGTAIISADAACDRLSIRECKCGQTDIIFVFTCFMPSHGTPTLWHATTDRQAAAALSSLQSNSLTWNVMTPNKRGTLRNSSAFKLRSWVLFGHFLTSLP